VLAGIDRLRHTEKHAGDGIAVDFDRQVLGGLGAFDLDLERPDLRVDRVELFLRRRLRVAERRR